jgi:hypothetical protein
LGFETYRREFRQKLHAMRPDLLSSIDQAAAQRTYRWDRSDVAAFKYVLNFVLDTGTREQIIKELFERKISDQKSFSQTLYFNWHEARQMQATGMIMGGHSHSHQPLARLGEKELGQDLERCRKLLDRNLRAQSYWPFSYPYGKKNSYCADVIRKLTELGFHCSFCTEVGANKAGQNLFELQRWDCKEAPTH